MIDHYGIVGKYLRQAVRDIKNQRPEWEPPSREQLMNMAVGFAIAANTSLMQFGKQLSESEITATLNKFLNKPIRSGKTQDGTTMSNERGIK